MGSSSERFNPFRTFNLKTVNTVICMHQLRGVGDTVRHHRSGRAGSARAISYLVNERDHIMYRTCKKESGTYFTVVRFTS